MDQQTPSAQEYWRKCTSCKKHIGFGVKYWVCSVSTCNRLRTGLVFCNLNCFDAHIPVLNHRDAGAFERKAPTQQEWKKQQEAESAPPKPAAPKPAAPTVQAAQKPVPQVGGPPAQAQGAVNTDDILVVVSKLKAYIREKSGMSTSDSVMKVLSRKLRQYSDEAITRAAQDGRKTVLDRDIR